VSIDEGTHKYVLISAMAPCTKDERPTTQHFVVSRRGAPYHQNVAEGFVQQLEAKGYSNIDIQGGGRILLDSPNAQCHIYGFSYGFGLADHALSKKLIESDSKFHNFNITWSNDGY
jgi:phosphohistidine phosphatase